MRLIDADELKTAFPRGEYVRTESVRATIDHMPTIQPEPHWIPVDLRSNFPEENKVVLLGVRFRDDFKYFVTSRKDYNYWTGLGREIKGELRWQPLPLPYQPEEE